MSSTVKQLFFVFLILIPTLVITVLTFYMAGFKKYGLPAEYQMKQDELLKARQDSIRALESVISPEIFGDSIMFGMDDHTKLFEEKMEVEKHITTCKTTLDSLRGERSELEEKEKDIIEQRSFLRGELDTALDENLSNLAKIYDSMKSELTVPLIIAENDTLAVRIILRMQPRNAAKLLGAVAEADVDKAKRLNRLLVLIGTMR